ncbi:MAG: DEAD/DEAH box helicase [Nitrososphaerota archaeon]|jgi:hypothetical protein|nr:DEAD/DEAH box helicase [Nitrososphaerota archaeon]MDG7036796.1 DEAD/DEAH box helicase [Nitrososphaerota archaeon]MDG7039137.1 DEAD/DEAH box helicase [Nitrososphaerota archaeon]
MSPVEHEEHPTDCLVIAEKLMDALSDVGLDPHPHFRILPPSRQEDEPRLWKIGGRNEMGYILEDKRTDSFLYTTIIRFQIKTSLTNFLDIIINVNKSVKKANLEVEIKVGGEPPVRYAYSGRDTTIEVPVIGGSVPKMIKLRLVKDIRQHNEGNTILFKISNETPMERVQEGHRRYDFGNLLNLYITEESQNAFACELSSIKSYGLLPIPGSPPQTIAFRDYYISTTRIPIPKVGKLTIKELSEVIKTRKGSIDKLVQNYFESKLEENGGRLYSFQERAIEELSAQIADQRKPCLIIARTAAGKTEAFMIPILTRILELKRAKSIGVKAILFYPTKALASDQLQRFLEVAFWINKNIDDKITIGVYHGDIDEKASLKIPLPLHCVKHEKDLEDGKLTAGQVRLKIDDEGILGCPICHEKYPFIEANRYTVTLNPPDILVCTPDIMNGIIMSDRTRHVFFGAPTEVTYCPNCKLVLRNSPELCKDCNLPPQKLTISPSGPPDIILLDELHLFNSIFGGNVANLLKRLQLAMSHYSSSSKPAQLVATSATIKNPIEFGTNFFGKKVSVIETTDDDYDFDNPLSKVVVFATPRAYRMIDSVSYTLYNVLNRTNLRTLVFVNSLTQSSMLLNDIKQRLSADANTISLSDQVDGHTSNYTRQERAEIEEKFNSGQIRALVATSTLEVGVDFKGLDGLILYGAPQNINNYIQRVGRVGRKNDAVVFVFLNPDDPIDLYYFRNSLKLAADPTAFIEYPPFPADNDILARKHVLCTIYDVACIMGMDTTQLLKDFITNGSISNPKANHYLESAWSPPRLKAASYALARATAGIPDNQLCNHVSKRFNLFNIRKVDETVRVDFDEPHQAGQLGYGGFDRRFDGGQYRAYRQAGLTQRDINTLREIKRT